MAARYTGTDCGKVLYRAQHDMVTSLHWHPIGIATFIMYSTIDRGIEKVTWDASGERLALSYKDGDDMYSGLIAIYDTKRTPLVSASLVLALSFCSNMLFLFI
ncbi:hypothetical protein BHE74_00054772 [Ensete ventricosum]|nr:hypothetical protein BHE74_00054772 [Ensete ventricosum]